ncbi:hypothetical protein [Idiomarina sp. HP20-50]|uniref:hypothetical protein n=1 Tax=Idiomarina sp. HP20-50 TaxID=3070813 RepID=UPI00294AB8BE|nr:hypothetical protein [Idiomarina sp. HP20-50]MDV6314907.1 hypothetical protein [Idiomarina sp. HP20-50]
MNKAIIILLPAILLSACGATQPEPYEKDVSPKNRQEYNGIEGMAQYQKDQNYLMDKELADKCAAARMELIIAESENNTNEIKKQKALIEDTCV